MHPKLAEAFARTDWHVRTSVDDLVREQCRAFEMALSRVATMDPSVAAAFAAALAAGLPDHVVGVVMTAAAVRQQEAWNMDAKVRGEEIARVEGEVSWAKAHMREILEVEYQQAVRRSQMPISKAAFALQVLLGRTLTGPQALLIGYGLVEDAGVPLESKRAWEKAALYDMATEAVWSHAMERATAQERTLLVTVKSTLTTEAVRDALDGTRPGQGRAVADVARAVAGAVEALPGIAPDQRVAVAKVVEDTVTKYAAKRGFSDGFPVDATARTEHAAGLNAALATAVSRAVLKGRLDLDPVAVDAILDSVAKGIDGIQTPGQGRAGAFARVHGAMVDGLAAKGVAVTATAADALADIGRTALRDAARVARDPERASDTDMTMLRAVAAVAERVEPEIERLHRADLQAVPATSPSVMAAVARVQTWTERRVVEPDVDATPKPR